MSKVVCEAFAGDFLLDGAPQSGRPDDMDGDQIETLKVKVLVAQWCLTLWDPVDCSPPGSSVHGILQANILEWLPHPSPEDLPNPGIKSGSLCLLHLQADFLPLVPLGKPDRTV